MAELESIFTEVEREEKSLLRDSAVAVFGLFP